MKKDNPILIADTAKNEKLKKLSMQPLENFGDLVEKWNTKMQTTKQLAKKIRDEI